MELIVVDKDEFESYILAGYTIPELQKLYGLSRSKIAQYKRDFGFVGLTPNSRKSSRESGEKQCNSCKKILNLTEFYSNGISSTGLVKYKPACIKCENKQRTDNFSSKILSYLKSQDKEYKCEECSYTGIWGSLDFHHIDPNNKEFNIGSSNKTISDTLFNTTIVPELKKCKLLCPNCHRQKHLLMGWK